MDPVSGEQTANIKHQADKQNGCAMGLLKVLKTAIFHCCLDLRHTRPLTDLKAINSSTMRPTEHHKATKSIPSSSIRSNS